MNYYIEKAEKVNNIVSVIGWAFDDNKPVTLSVASGESFLVKRVARPDVDEIYGLSNVKCGFEMYVECPGNSKDVTLEMISENKKDTVKKKIPVIGFEKGADFSAEFLTDILTVLSKYGIRGNFEKIEWREEQAVFMLFGWEFSISDGKSHIKSRDVSVSIINTTRKDVQSHFATQGVVVDEFCGFSVSFDGEDGCELEFTSAEDVIKLTLGRHLLGEISGYNNLSFWKKSKFARNKAKQKYCREMYEIYDGEEGYRLFCESDALSAKENLLNEKTYSFAPVSKSYSAEREDIVIDVIIIGDENKVREADAAKSVTNQRYKNYNVIYAGDDVETAVRRCKGNCLTVVNPEDCFKENYFEAIVAAICLNPNAEILYFDYDVVVDGTPAFNVNRAESYCKESRKMAYIASVYRKATFYFDAPENRICKGITDICYHVNMDKLTVADTKIKPIAFYLPQYHENEENNEWWGKGFTEWTNVRRATPMFEGHHQPRIPGDLGYYNLGDDGTSQRRQVELAKKYGVYGFCIYYYWFNGRRLLRKPLDDFFENKDINFPYCICWANETWSRRWTGEEKEILMQQVHNEESDTRFILDAMEYFKDSRYIRIDGKPLLVIYRIGLFPKPARTISNWRKICREKGIGEIHIALVQGFGFIDHRIYGADSSIEFPPHKFNVEREDTAQRGAVDGYEGRLYSYSKMVDKLMNVTCRDYNMFPGAMLEWDNTARRMENSDAYCDYSPETFRKWLSRNGYYSMLYSDDSITFINAWNEWAEGTYLEPDDKYGYAALEAVKCVTGTV